MSSESWRIEIVRIGVKRILELGGEVYRCGGWWMWRIDVEVEVEWFSLLPGSGIRTRGIKVLR